MQLRFLGQKYYFFLSQLRLIIRAARSHSPLQNSKPLTLFPSDHFQSQRVWKLEGKKHFSLSLFLLTFSPSHLYKHHNNNNSRAWLLLASFTDNLALYVLSVSHQNNPLTPQNCQPPPDFRVSARSLSILRTRIFFSLSNNLDLPNINNSCFTGFCNNLLPFALNTRHLPAPLQLACELLCSCLTTKAHAAA